MYQKYCNSNTLVIVKWQVMQCVIIDEAGIFNCTSLGYIYTYGYVVRRLVIIIIIIITCVIVKGFENRLNRQY